ncbi:MAG: hypothetical protein IPK00_00715 [Deltaproteobacteria bacterium]|nr:hypothetical protein [Deltaproteobacteria bacterium]
MWQRIVRGGGRGAPEATQAVASLPASRRAYYRVSAWVPTRLRRLAPSEVAASIYDLSLPERLAPAVADGADDSSALMARLRRIEDKLDRLLGAASLEAPRPLSGRDRLPIVFSGAGLALEVDFEFRRGDAFRVEMLLPTPAPRIVRAVAEAVADAVGTPGTQGPHRLALAFRHIEAADRDALVAYSYDIQRLELRAKVEGAGARP